MPKIRILEVVSGLGIGGAERALLNRLELAPSYVDELIFDLRPSISVLNHPHEIEKIDLELGLKLFSYRFITHIRKIDPDCIIVRTPIDFIRVGFLSLLGLIDTKLVLEIHSEFVSERHIIKRLMDIAIRILRNQADLVFSVSKHTQNGSFGKIFKTSEVMYLGSKIPAVSKATTVDNGVRYLVAGRNVKVKRPLWILERIGVLRHALSASGAKFVFVGGGPLLSEMINYVERNNLSSIVEILGSVDNVHEYMSASDFLVSASLSEGLPLVFYEAKLSGLRIITTPSGGGEEILGESDVLLTDFSENSFEAAILTTCSQKTTYGEKQRISMESQWMSTSKRTGEFYKRICLLLSNI